MKISDFNESQLSIEHLKGILSYDPATGYFRWLVSPAHRVKVGDRAGSDTRRSYVYIKIYSVLYLAHRLAWFHFYGQWPAGYIDHVNGDAKDNRICNLRVATPCQNSANQGSRGNSIAGLKGVWRKRDKWSASIMRNGKKTYLGTFDTAEAAHGAYRAFAKEVDGEFLRT